MATVRFRAAYVTVTRQGARAMFQEAEKMIKEIAKESTAVAVIARERRDMALLATMMA